ncbi:FAD-binding oxidoreductase [Synechococcus sp. CBW1002]|uniref:FAD-binding oxidoreductase n=1 Tax=Synechococcus sp. CBW1002 TaxID=1353134 RepID=UPI0018CE3C92|nr:FAD-binding oxidoreductase [Synechococcus sp. CBW1002]QPN61502.1 FAD-binding oxidoreductase [Synechococcus sp. CBW1002]
MISPEPHELPDLVRDLHQRALPWLPAGQASRLTWGPAVEPGSTVLSCRRLNRVLEHNPGDFTITVQAGTPLVEVQEALNHHRQWLAVDFPWGRGSSGSIGGLVARGLAGGFRHRYLGIRDQLIGIGLLRADGVAARAGGKVVKNVAGYDLMRLFCGSWGSLGLITELTLRTLPLPPQRRGLWIQGDLAALGRLSRWLLRSSLTPERVDWWSGPLAAQAGLADQPLLLLSLASVSPQTLEEQIACLGEQALQAGPLHCQPLDGERLEALQAIGQGQTTAEPAWLLRLGVKPGQAEQLLAAPCLRQLPLVLGAGSGLGLAWAAPDACLPAYRVEELRRLCKELGGYLTVLLQPTGAGLAAWEDAPSRPLIEAVKRQFDPRQLLARGRLPGVRPLT